MSERDEGFLARWSRRKHASREVDAAAAPAPGDAGSVAPKAPVPPRENPEAPPASTRDETRPRGLPAIESLTPESDFAPFMQAGVDADVKGQALKTLFSDPALYPMDGLDVYIDDYTKPDPLPRGWLEKLNQFASLNGEPDAASAASTEPPAARDSLARVDAGTGEGPSSSPAPVPDDPPAGEGSGG